MAAVYKTPGVYVEEISTLPPSVAAVATAVPAFIGYTEKGFVEKGDPVIKRIATMLEFRTAFGGPDTASFEVTWEAGDEGEPDEITKVVRTAPGDHKAFSLYYALRHYFANGGGPCYVVSVGSYSATGAVTDFEAGLEALEKEDEPTLIVLTDAAQLLGDAEYYGVCKKALAQCKKLGDRFTIVDVVPAAKGDAVEFFRDTKGIGADYLMYGAAYYPYLQTSLTYEYDEEEKGGVTVKNASTPPATKGATDQKTTTSSTKPASALADIKNDQTALYNKIKSALNTQWVDLPPSAAMAGIYARVDREQGVWKAPANVGVMAVLGPVAKITNDEQDDLNVDPTAGKSVNAIRDFTGRGTLVWGARTLAGNDNEWRYVSVRRLFITIEESTKKASAFAVFEANDQSTWLKVKAMIESYLYGLWEQGALAGAKPEAAYYVHVGLGTTMTPQDVLDGRMIVEIGVAAVRPAEFIVLRFAHKLQTA